MTLTNRHIIAAFIALGLTVFVLNLSTGLFNAQASAPSGLPATIATTSSQILTAATAELVVATSSCSSRVITTSGSAVMMTFSANQGLIPSGFFGHLQAASTTVAYDSGLYGCNALTMYSFTTQYVTVSESN